MNDHIRTLRKTLGLKQREFAARIGLKQSAVSYLEKSGSTVTDQNIKAICAQFGVDENWLRTGQGAMFLRREKEKKELLSLFDQLSPPLQDYLLKAARDLLKTQEKLQQEEG